MTDLGRAVAGLCGAAVVVLVLDAAVRTFLLPRVASVRLSRLIARTVGAVFAVVGSARGTYRQKDRRLAMYPPVLLLSYQACWLALSLVAFALLFLAAGVPSVARAFELSGSSLFTLGTTGPVGTAEMALSFGEAALGLTLLALLIAFIPTIYGAFQRRELSVSRLSVRAGVPATPWGIIELAKSVSDYGRLDELWREWESWFIELRETHTTLTILNWYRSPTPDQTWIGCAAAVLDSAALYNAVVDLPVSPAAGLCIRSGWLTFHGLADYFRIEYPRDPDGTEPISITREEFEVVLDHLARGGVPVIADHEQAWLDFAGWRVNYDAVLEAFEVMFTVPRLDWGTAGTQPGFAPSNRRGTHDKGRARSHPTS